ncbi:MAG TPA: ribonuclease P protein component, partial [Chitinophagaceae bacterium]|nr:ribonuclease P protein component [Chitinophagaceae bacterium]
KRLMREAYRLQKNSLQGSLAISGRQLAVFFLYTGKEVPDFNLIKEKMNLLLQNLEKSVK